METTQPNRYLEVGEEPRSRKVEFEVPEREVKAFTKLSVVIPVYNEKATIREVLERVVGVDIPLEMEIIITDDGSTDGSGQIIERQRLDRADIINVYTSPINLGKGAAIRVGFKFATGDVVIIQDADLELSPDEYSELIRPILDGRADVVYGSRFLRSSGNIPLKTRLANGFLTRLTNLLFRGKLTDMETAYKVFRRDVLETLHLRCVGFDIEPEITAKVLQAGWRIQEVPVIYNPRTANEGKKISWWDGVEAIYTLLKFRFR